MSVRAGGRQQGSRSGRPTKALELDGGPREPKIAKSRRAIGHSCETNGGRPRLKRNKTRPPIWAAPLAGDQTGRLGVSREPKVGMGSDPRNAAGLSHLANRRERV